MREVRRAGDRYLTEGDGLSTRHSFSYGRHYDPDDVGFGSLVAINEETLAPGAGYDAHRHADVEIVTWVLDGELAHRDGAGADGVVRPGTAQRLSAGEGVEHVERNASDTESLRFVQMMLRSDHWDAPEYASREVGPGALVEAVDVHRAGAHLFVARPHVDTVELPAAPFVLVHATRGELWLDDDDLLPGDEVRLAGEGASVLGGDGEALVWVMES